MQQRNDRLRKCFTDLDLFGENIHRHFRKRIDFYAETENGETYPLCYFVRRLDCARCLETPLHALRFASLFPSKRDGTNCNSWHRLRPALALLIVFCVCLAVGVTHGSLTDLRLLNTVPKSISIAIATSNYVPYSYSAFREAGPHLLAQCGAHLRAAGSIISREVPAALRHVSPSVAHRGLRLLRHALLSVGARFNMLLFLVLPWSEKLSCCARWNCSAVKATSFHFHQS